MIIIIFIRRQNLYWLEFKKSYSYLSLMSNQNKVKNTILRSIANAFMRSTQTRPDRLFPQCVYV